MYVSSVKEIEYNFSVMNETLSKGKGKELDLGFLEIFNHDIEALREPEAVKKELSQKLATLAEQLLTSHETQKVKSAETSPVGKPTSIGALAATYVNGPVKRGLEKLDKEFVMVPITGDGHCFFRSMATFAVKKWLQIPNEEKERYYAALEERVLGLDSEPLINKFHEYKKLLRSLAKGTLKEEEVTHNQKHSDSIVAFFREFACEYNRKHRTSTFTNDVKDRTGKTVDEYCRDMSNMKLAEYADEAELVALAKALGFNIRVLDAKRVGEGVDYKLASFRKSFENDKPDDVYLLFRPSHYDLAFKK